jgi:PAS domain S-box-containing protein
MNPSQCGGGTMAGPAPGEWPAGLDERSVLRELFVSSPDALILVDGAGTVVLANPQASALLGYAREELVGMSVDLLVPEATRQLHAGYRQGYARAPRSRPMGTHMELCARRKDGSDVTVEIALSPLQSDGAPLVVAAIRDIGTYPRVKQALQRARYSEHLAQLGRLAVDLPDPRSLLDRAPLIAAEAMQIDAARLHVRDGDGATARVVGAVGDWHDDAIDADSLDAHRRPTVPDWVLEHGRPLTVADFAHDARAMPPRADSGAVLQSALAVPLSDRGRTVGVLSVYARSVDRFGADELSLLESIASLLSTCMQRARSEAALEHAQRLESVGQLTGGIAHDFNNLLTVIQGNLQVLADRPALADDQAARQLLGAAARATRRGAELTRQLLAFARRQVLQPTAVDVRTMLHALAELLRRTLDQRIRIEVDVTTDCPAVLADAGQLESALLNIAINARDAMPDGGELRFAARRGDTPAASDATATGTPFVAIRIGDTGSGMSEAVRARAFEPFFTTKPAGRGTGLGLSAVHGFANQSRGEVTIDSTPGAGTTLTLLLPQADAGAPADTLAAGATAAGADTSPLPKALKVLLVEDDSEVAATLGELLQTLHCEVTTMGSGEQALATFDFSRPFDVLLSDIALGAGMRGTELAARAARRLPGLAVLLMSGFSAELLAADRDAPHRWELLHKPCTRDDLRLALTRALAGAAAERG